MRINPVAAVLLAVAVVGLIVAIRGTQDNLLSAIAGHPVGEGANTPSSGPSAAARQSAANVRNAYRPGGLHIRSVAAEQGNPTESRF